MFRDFEMEILGSMGDRCRTEGIIEGRIEGIIEGRTEVRANILLDLLEAKFGSVPEQIKTLVKSASPDQLKDWMISVLNASTLESVFQANHGG